MHAQNAAEVPHTGFVFAVESKKGCATKLTFCDTSVGWVNPSASSVRTLYPSPRLKRARLSHAVAPPLPTEPACAGLRRGPDFSPCHLPLHKGGFWPGACSDVVLSGEILPISSLKSDNRNTAVPRPPCVKGAQTVEKPHVNARRTDDLASSKSPRQSFSIRRWKNKLKSVFFGDMSIEKNTSQPASVESGRPLTRLCAQRAASPRKNACIFEKRVELFRHAQQKPPPKGGGF